MESIFRIFNKHYLAGHIPGCDIFQWWGPAGWVRNPAEAYWFKTQGDAKQTLDLCGERMFKRDHSVGINGIHIEEIKYNRYKKVKNNA